MITKAVVLLAERRGKKEKEPPYTAICLVCLFTNNIMQK